MYSSSCAIPDIGEAGENEEGENEEDETEDPVKDTSEQRLLEDAAEQVEASVRNEHAAISEVKCSSRNSCVPYSVLIVII